MKDIKIWVSEMENYKLLDSGGREKLEEINGTRIVRKEPRAWWEKSLPEEEWKKTETSLEAVVDIFAKNIGDPEQSEGGIKAKIKFNSKSKHIGIFPEQFPQWKWIEDRLKDLKIERFKDSGEKGEEKELNILNLFGYTGIASLVAAQSGLSRGAEAKWNVKVAHVDASKQSVDWARENQKLSGLENAPIRWIVDDVVKFLKKEKNRQKNLPAEERGYDAIIMDPPQFGKGPKGEVWKIEEKLPELLEACRQILSDEPLFVIFNMYSTELSSISVANLLADMTKGLGGSIESGELAIKQRNSDRLLPMSIFALWQKQ